MNVNQVIIAGRLTRDTELKHTPSNMAICDGSLAINRKYKDKEEVTYIDFRAFGKLAEAIHQYNGQKGQSLLIIGEIRQDRWQGKDGTARSKVYVVANGAQFVGGGRREEGERRERDDSDSRYSDRDTSDPRHEEPEHAPQFTGPSGADIPF